MTKATADQVHKSYEDRGFLVRIDQDGHVEFRASDDLPWAEGRWVSEYRVIDGKVVLS